MCFIELEPSEVWRETWRTARKPHRCQVCGQIITVGERYVVTFQVYEGTAATGKTCGACQANREEFAEAHEGALGMPDYFVTMLSDCIAEGDDESETLWRPMLAAITARKRL